MSVFSWPSLVRESGVGLELLQRGVANNAAWAECFIGFKRVVAGSLSAEGLRPVGPVVALGAGDAIRAVALADGAGGVERSPGVADEIGVEACSRADAARKLAAVAEVDGD